MATSRRLLLARSRLDSNSLVCTFSEVSNGNETIVRAEGLHGVITEQCAPFYEFEIFPDVSFEGHTTHTRCEKSRKLDVVFDAFECTNEYCAGALQS